eukprot:1310081-Rhodomonas_salina.1
MVVPGQAFLSRALAWQYNLQVLTGELWYCAMRVLCDVRVFATSGVCPEPGYGATSGVCTDIRYGATSAMRCP